MHVVRAYAAAVPGREVEVRQRVGLGGLHDGAAPPAGVSSTIRRDGDAAALQESLGWLMSKGSQLEMPGQGGSFRRRTARFWELWPMPVADGEWHHVLYVDGIWLARNLGAPARDAQEPPRDVAHAQGEGGALVVPHALGGLQDGYREARHDAD